MASRNRMSEITGLGDGYFDWNRDRGIGDRGSQYAHIPVSQYPSIPLMMSYYPGTDDIFRITLTGGDGTKSDNYCQLAAL